MKGSVQSKNILQTSFPTPGLMCSLNESIRETGTKTVEIKGILFWEMKEKFWQKKPKTHSRKAHLLVKLTNVQKKLTIVKSSILESYNLILRRHD